MENLADGIHVDYACRALLGGGKGKSVMDELKRLNRPYYEQVMSAARAKLKKEGVKMASYPTCRECGNDLTSFREEEEGLCFECQGKIETFTVTLKNGQEVQVTWHKDYFEATDHLELHGPMTETGYLSHFLPKADKNTELSHQFVITCAALLAQEHWDENKAKYGKQLTLIN
jgi:hypothetical protein